MSSVVINLSGTSVSTWGSTGNFVGTFAGQWARNHVIWNLYQETNDIRFNNISFNGSVLAPSAAITTDINSFQGSIFAQSLSQGGEVHRFLYQGYTPNVGAAPEPSGLAMLGPASTCGLGYHLRRRAA